jgi:hypothetical protein
MAANTAPIFSKLADVQMSAIFSAANTAKDGTGTVNLLFTAGADGGFIDRLVIMPLGTNVDTVLRVFLNNGADPTVATNNSMIKQQTMPATTNSEVASLQEAEIPMGFPIPAGYRLYATLGTAVAAGFIVTTIGGKY